MMISRAMTLLALVPLLAGCGPTLVDVSGTSLPRPATLSTVALDGKVGLYWSDEAYLAAPARFKEYLVYSAPYNFDTSVCQTPWLLEGSTVGPAFIVSALNNGTPECFSVTATTIDNVESERSPVETNTPRFQAQGLAWSVDQSAPATAGLRLWKDDNGDGMATRSELGVIMSATGDVDLTLERLTNGKLYLMPSRTGTDMQVFGSAPVSEMAPIGEAPLSGYTRTGFEAIPGWMYLVRTVAADGYYRFGAIRVLTTTDSYILIDWAFQSDPGNPMLMRAAP
jgi:hypothetical protein